MNRETRLGLGLFLASTLYFLLSSEYWLGPFDEGIILTGAFRILNGDIPSIDFYTNYGPGQFYLLAGLFRLFGPDALVARFYDAAVSGILVTLSFLEIQRVYPRWLAACCVLAIASILQEYQGHLSPLAVCTLLGVVAAFRVGAVLAAGKGPRAYLPLSFALGFLLVIRYDLAAIVSIALASSIILIHGTRERRSGKGTSAMAWAVLSRLLALAVVPLLTLLLLGAVGILQPALSDLVVYNSSNYVAMRSLPFPGPSQSWRLPGRSLSIYLPVIACGLGAATIFFRNRLSSPAPVERKGILIVVLSIVTGFFFTKGWVRTSGQHMLFANVPGVVLVFLCLHHLLPNDRRRLFVLLLIAGVVFQRASVSNWDSDPLYRHLGELGFEEDLPGLSVFRLDPDRLEAAHFIVENTAPQERILSAAGRHDKVFINDVAVYFVTRRMPGTRWHQFDPGVQTTRTVQREMIRELDSNQVSLIMRDSSWDELREPNQSAESSGVHDLDRFIDEGFQEVAEFGALQVSRREGPGQP